MKYFDKFYTKKILQTIKQKIPSNQHHKDVVFFLTSTNNGALIRREEFNKYLEVGFRHDVIDADLTSRLQSIQFGEFIQARNELMAAWYFEKIAGFTIAFRPKGSGNSVGEFSLISKNVNIFVEVKSPWKETPSRGVFAGHDGSTIRQNLNKARRQLPKDGRPTMIVMSGKLKGRMSDPLDGMLQALYGEPYWKVPVSYTSNVEDPKEAWNLNGLFQPTSNTRISVVATLQDLLGSPYQDSILMNYLSNGEQPIDLTAPKDVLKYSLKIYHNPYAVNPISQDLFSRWDQFLPVKDKNHLEWKQGVS